MINAGEREVAAGGGRVRRAPLAILLAEGDADLRSLMAATLRQDGHQVIEARDGADLMADLACAYLAGSEAVDTPLVVADLRLPVTDGFLVIRELQKQGKHPDVIVVTAVGDREARVEAARLGALAVLDKPVDLRDLREAVGQFARARLTA